MQITFRVPGAPRGKGRPRFTRTGHTYTPEETAAYESLIRLAYQQAAKGQRFEGPVSIVISAFMPIPQSWSQKKRAAANGKYCMSKPDIDNIIKAVLDALNTVAFADDKQVTEIVVTKTYADAPEVIVIAADATQEV